MITMTPSSVVAYMKERFPDIANILCNGHVRTDTNQSIGIFLGSDTRSTGKLAIGGIDCTVVRMLPINIHVHWSENQIEHDNKAVSIYNKLLTEENNFIVDGIKIACIEMLDGCPKPLGRDEKNVCESIIRANFYYYV